MQRGYITTVAKSYLESGDLLAALLKVSADLEALLFDKLFFEKRIKAELIKGWTLGRYIEWVVKHGLIDAKYVSFLREFNKLRNAAVHDRTYWNRNLPEKAEEIKDMIKRGIELIEDVKVTYKSDHQLEMEFTDHFERVRK